MPEFDPSVHCYLRQPTFPRPKTIIGRKFNRLTPLGFLGMVNNRSHWLLRCKCGAFWVADIGALQRGYTQSCGCLNRELVLTRSTTHGQASRGPIRSQTYVTWCAIISRCHNPKNGAYRYYGGRGIVVCDRWRHSFENFFADMGHPPTAKHSIERQDNSLGYSPENCIWATQDAQAQNKRSNRRITANGETRILMEWSRLRNIPRERIANRLLRGWSPEEALELVQRTDRRLRAYRESVRPRLPSARQRAGYSA